jgi:hypothetical protein
MVFGHYKTHADMDIPVEGLTLVGYVMVGYEELVEKLGYPCTMPKPDT